MLAGAAAASGGVLTDSVWHVVFVQVHRLLLLFSHVPITATCIIHDRRTEQTQKKHVTSVPVSAE